MANAKGAYKKKLENIENVYARYQLLISSLEEQGNVSKEFVAALGGQRKFSAFFIKGTLITPLSLNTMKVIANEILAKDSPNGKGFEYLDGLRTKLHQIVKNQNNSRSPKAKLARQKDTSQQLQANLRQAELMNLQRSKAYLDVIRRVRELLSSGAIDEISKIKLTNLMEDHNDLYSHLLSPSCTIGTDGTLRVIKEASGDE